MKKLTLYKKLKYSYLFIDIYNNEYELFIEFNGIDFDLIEGDIVYFPDRIINEKNFYAFGPIMQKYTKNNNPDENEFIKIKTKNNEFFLQRYYG